MTRQELYDLVWSKPITHIAKDFGMSDQGIRKHCVKADIPTPPLGYWAKLAHGKKVQHPKLPIKQFPADADVPLAPRAEKYRTDTGYDLRKLAEANAELQAACAVPDELPKSRPAIVRAVATLLKQADTNSHGFQEAGGSYSPEFLVSKQSLDRLSRILYALNTVADSQSHRLFLKDEKLYWQVGEERFLVRIRETADKKPHEPTKAELKEQARRADYSWYSPNRKAYRSWDYFPSGRLSISLSDTVGNRWERERIEKRWRDTTSRTLESRLPEIFFWLEEAEPLARSKRLEAERQAREEAERLERLRQQRERRKLAEELEKAICDMADINQRRQRVMALAEVMRAEEEADPRILEEVVGYAEVLRKQICERHLPDAVREAAALSGSGLLISALLETPAETLHYW
ncbi:hypothetical protein R0135_14160 [Congregibacter variabilis]|uniref:Uncharacterized protein n=1 Tax=Congregibacter variabilis TaxID=3081200 RepID=A0ABZ0I080_9GAMM|nr:hypothetical protein R0135_14160 [Congregibacter sp. IMCC43200]